MLRFAADENLNGDIVRGLFRRQPDLDLIRVQDVGLSGADDRDGLEREPEPSQKPPALSCTREFPVRGS
jgi:hypothetical protein